MNRFYTIKNKLIVIILLISIVSYSLIFISVYLRNTRKEKLNFASDHKLHAKLIAEYCAVPLDFEFKNEAIGILSKLKVQPDILNVNLVDIDHNLFATYAKNSTTTDFEFTNTDFDYYFSDEHLFIYESIFLNHSKIGGLYIRISTDGLKQTLLMYARNLLVILGSQLIVVYILAFFLQKIITKPILNLSKFAQLITNQQDFSKRIERNQSDETGILYSSFNKMLQQIQKRDQKINSDKLILEKKNNEYVLINKELQVKNVELIEAKEKAEESEKLKSAFLANMSHEIRTPMNGILGFLDLLNNSKLNETKRSSYIKIVEKSGYRLLNTINDIIDISRIDAGQSTILLEDLNIVECVNDLYDFFKVECKEKGLLLRIDNLLNTDKYNLVSDRGKLDSILTNLIKNAIKFTDSGHIIIGISKDRGFLKFRVEDTGIGVSEKRKNSIFNRFEQGNAKDKNFHEGSGLGLSISKAYVEMLGGEIAFESKENVGTNFYFTLPMNLQ